MKITDAQVISAIKSYRQNDEQGSIVSINGMRAALEAAFPEQQPASSFGKLVVTEWMAREVRSENPCTQTIYIGALQDALQSFVDAHSIKPIAFADRIPNSGQEILVFGEHWSRWGVWYPRDGFDHSTHWLPASALPIPEPAVDAIEEAWREYCSDWRSVGVKASRLDFLAGYEAGQAGGKP